MIPIKYSFSWFTRVCSLSERLGHIWTSSVVFRTMLTLLFTNSLTLVVLAQFVVGHQLFACLKTVHFLPAVVENMLFC